jgi:hypothetical protein
MLPTAILVGGPNVIGQAWRWEQHDGDWYYAHLNKPGYGYVRAGGWWVYCEVPKEGEPKPVAGHRMDDEPSVPLEKLLEKSKCPLTTKCPR